MSRRVTQVVLLCEDSQHEAFARRFLDRLGIGSRAIRVEKAPRGRGSAERWVREVYPTEVKAFRGKPFITGRTLVVMIDEDTASTDARATTLRQALADHDLLDRSPDEAIIHIIPARNIETWITWLAGQDVDETKAYPKLARERDCADQVRSLKEMCDRRELRQPAPASLERACVEFHTRWRRIGAPG